MPAQLSVLVTVVKTMVAEFEEMMDRPKAKRKGGLG